MIISFNLGKLPNGKHKGIPDLACDYFPRSLHRDEIKKVATSTVFAAELQSDGTVKTRSEDNYLRFDNQTRTFFKYVPKPGFDESTLDPDITYYKKYYLANERVDLNTAEAISKRYICVRSTTHTSKSEPTYSKKIIQFFTLCDDFKVLDEVYWIHYSGHEIMHENLLKSSAENMMSDSAATYHQSEHSSVEITNIDD